MSSHTIHFIFVNGSIHPFPPPSLAQYSPSIETDDATSLGQQVEVDAHTLIN